ncbi:MAG TPA: magnesium/cobalt transporter CorA [Candidatus Nanoarchaeia archaeon]|nr:magnesium/cobalt transporter CorA [Candidatus Nanoarchaeia archaeon]
MLKIISLRNELVELKDVSEIDSSPTWIDVNRITAQEAAILQSKFDLHLLTLEDLSVISRTWIKVEEFPNYLLCVFYSMQKNKPVEGLEVDYIIGKNFLITNHREQLHHITDLWSNKEKTKKLLSKGVDFLFHYLLSQDVESFYPVLDKLDREVELIEEEISKKVSTHVLQRIISLKNKIIYVKKFALSQKEKISIISKSNVKFLSKRIIPYFRDIYDNAIHVFETTENYRESASSVYELYMSTVSNNMNEVMKVLSIIATITLPLTVISSIYGTNFEILPGSSAKYGFWLMILGMASMMGLMILYFRRRGWF